MTEEEIQEQMKWWGVDSVWDLPKGARPSIKELKEKYQIKKLVYFVEAPQFRVIKIGQTANLKNRLRDMCAQAPVPITLNVLGTTTKFTEGYYHAKFRKLRQHGEWFKRTSWLITTIRKDCPDHSLGPTRKEWLSSL